jgi:hypothetical protein
LAKPINSLLISSSLSGSSAIEFAFPVPSDRKYLSRKRKEWKSRKSERKSEKAGLVKSPLICDDVKNPDE